MIEVDGVKYRTLKDPMYVDGKKVYQVWAEGNMVYPDPRYANLPDGRYVLKLAGHFQKGFEYRDMTKEGSPGGILTTESGSVYEPGYGTMTGNVETTIVSKKPIAVYEGEFKLDVSGFSRQYGNGGMYGKYEGYTFKPKGMVPPFPDCVATVGYRTIGTTYTFFHVWGLNTAKSMNYWVPTGAWAYAYKDGFRTDTGWAMIRGATSKKYYFDEPFSTPNTSVAQVSCAIEKNSIICGYRTSGNIPVEGVALWEASHDSFLGRQIYIVPFTEIVYNNNPPVTSPTFETDPPTEEPDDETKMVEFKGL